MQTETLQHRWAVGFRREFPCTKSHFLLHSHVLGHCQVTHKEVSGLSASIQPWMETCILTATPGFTKAQPFLVEASPLWGTVGHQLAGYTTYKGRPLARVPCSACHQCGLAREGTWSATAPHPIQTEANMIVLGCEATMPIFSSGYRKDASTSHKSWGAAVTWAMTQLPPTLAFCRQMLKGRQRDHRPLCLTREEQRPEQERTHYSVVWGGTFV